MKTKLSQDYEYLYDEICKGSVALCMVDYTWHHAEPSLRDPCTCRIKKDGSVDFSCRGRSYGGVEYWEEGDYKTRFLSECKRLNVEFVVIDKD